MKLSINLRERFGRNCKVPLSTIGTISPDVYSRVGRKSLRLTNSPFCAWTICLSIREAEDPAPSICWPSTSGLGVGLDIAVAVVCVPEAFAVTSVILSINSHCLSHIRSKFVFIFVI